MSPAAPTAPTAPTALSAPTAPADTAPSWKGPLRGRAGLVAVGVGVIVLHVWLAMAVWFQGPSPVTGSADATAGDQATVVFAELPRIRVTPPVSPAQQPVPAEASRSATASPAVPAPVPMTSPAPAPVPVPVAEAPTEAAAESPAPPAAEPPVPSGTPPRYRTQMPSPTRLVYRLQRGGFAGRAVLDWQFGSEPGAGYVLQLGSAGSGVMGDRWAWHSAGGFDGDGLAPLRHTDRRGGRERRAVNFQRAAGVVSWSASSRIEPLPPGLQDRVSWIVQLAAILNAEPGRREPGQRIEIWVAGLRGEVQDWRFEVLGAVDLPLPGGATARALHVVHEPLRPWAPRVELWLDPGREHLPMKMQFGGRPPLEPLELLRDDANAAGGEPPVPGS